MINKFDTSYYTYSKDQYIYIGEKRSEFEMALKKCTNGKVHYILDLSDCRNVNDLFIKVKRDYKFPNYFGNNYSAIGDCLMNYAYEGQVAFLEVINWQKYDKIDHASLYNFFDTLFFSAQESKRLENINYYIYLDEIPDFKNPSIVMFKYNLVK